MRMRSALAVIVVPTVAGVAAGVGAGRLRRWYRTWGVDRAEVAMPLAGDDVVPAAVASETRGIDVDAPPEAVWPWLLQMGYGRAGWYSYDQLDQRGRSAEAIDPRWASLAVGDIVPTHPGGGFEVAAIDPGRSLVLRSDTALVTAQAETARAAGAGLETGTAGVRMSGAMLSGTPQQFAVSWAFVLEPRPDGRTRLIERFRIWYPSDGRAPRFVMPMLGFGLFVMLQKQLVGIRDRAERLARSGTVASTPPIEPTSAGTTMADPVVEVATTA